MVFIGGQLDEWDIEPHLSREIPIESTYGECAFGDGRRLVQKEPKKMCLQSSGLLVLACFPTIICRQWVATLGVKLLL